MKKLFLLLLLPTMAHAQIDWMNYSTSFQGNGKEGTHPVLVTAIPYNGIYGGASYSSNTPEDSSLADSHSAPEEQRPRYFGISYTIDSGYVYFLAPGTHRNNADKYEFRVLLDKKTLLLPWGPITRFTDPGKVLNEFKDQYGFLGGYKNTWGHSVIVDLREKATKTIISSAMVFWRNAHPSLSRIYTAQNLQNLIGGRRPYGDSQPDSAMNSRLAALAQGRLQLQPRDNTLIFYVNAQVYRRQALEYQLLHDGSPDRPWGPNDFDNNAIFLQNLPPGQYTLQLRLRAQRHNVSSYTFTIRPAWYETKLFRIGLGALEGASLIAVILLVILFRQRRRTRREKNAREKLGLELGYIRSQLNPHFIFNALSSIQGLVNSHQLDAANRYLTDFGSLLRDSLAGSDKDSHPLPQEIRILDTYLSLEQLRFGFRYEITTAPDLPADTTEIPAFLLQPLVENAVKHGVSGLHADGLVHITFSQENANFIAEVTDNGKGWDTTAEAKGYGLRLTKQRINLLNQLSPQQPITLTIRSQTGDGATIRLQFTNWWI